MLFVVGGWEIFKDEKIQKETGLSDKHQCKRYKHPGRPHLPASSLMAATPGSPILGLLWNFWPWP